jgi:peptide/nickel transport system permease protein
VSLAVGIGSAALAGLLGLILGGTAGMAGPVVQGLLMRLVDVILSFPVFLLAVTLLAVTTPSLVTIIAIIGINYAAALARIVFGQVVSLRTRDFIVAARAAGVGNVTILRRHVTPHVLPSVFVFCALSVSSAIMLEAALSYVGIGIQPPHASWGNMISEGQSYIGADPWLVLLPAAAIMLAVLGFSLLGDGLRDVLDPTLERRRLWPGAARRQDD